MSEPFIGEIRAYAFDYAPIGYAVCNGATLPVSQNPALFALIRNFYGGDGSTTFGLPNLQASVTAGVGSNGFTSVGTTRGDPSTTLTTANLPSHSHGFVGQSSTLKTDFVASPADQPYIGKGLNLKAGNFSPLEPYAPLTSSLTAFAPNIVSSTGGSEPHENRQPFLALNYCIALEGIFPTFP
jgi:microcystin-dependent protein